MKKSRQLHLWIGLLCSILILVESITGLLLSERWLLGVDGEQHEVRVQQAMSAGGEAGSSQAGDGQVSGGEGSNAQANASQASSSEGDRAQQAAGSEAMRRRPEGGNSLMMIVRQLHEGRIGTLDVKWLADLSAIAMIILTITGITLSIKTLRAQRISKMKRQQVTVENEGMR